MKNLLVLVHLSANASLVPQRILNSLRQVVCLDELAGKIQ